MPETGVEEWPPSSAQRLRRKRLHRPPNHLRREPRLGREQAMIAAPDHLEHRLRLGRRTELGEDPLAELHLVAPGFAQHHAPGDADRRSCQARTRRSGRHCPQVTTRGFGRSATSFVPVIQEPSSRSYAVFSATLVRGPFEQPGGELRGPARRLI
jgi:hypothetical protein